MREDCIKARDLLKSDLCCEVVGPGSEGSLPDKETEIITDLPESRYYVGVLFPPKQPMGIDNDEVSVEAIGDLSEDEPDEYTVEEVAEQEHAFASDDLTDNAIMDDSIDEVIALSTQNKPSSIGVSFLTEGKVDSITVVVSFATYHRTVYDECCIPYTGSLSAETIENSVFGLIVYRDGGFLKLRRFITKREVKELWEHEHDWAIELREPLYKLVAQCDRQRSFRRDPHRETLSIRCNAAAVKGVAGVEFACVQAVSNSVGVGKSSVTVMLYNAGTEGNVKGSYDGTNTMLQPQIIIDVAKNPAVKIIPYDDNLKLSRDEEERSLALLYRGRLQYGSGHGVAVNWDASEEQVSRVFTDLMPTATVPQVDFDFAFKSGVDRQSLSLKYLSDLSPISPAERLTALKQLADAYSRWVDDLANKMPGNGLNDVAERHITGCREAHARMTAGIKLLESDTRIMDAFQLANRAMLMQMHHIKTMQNVREPEADEYPAYSDIDYRELDNGYLSFVWRPFQLAFFLMSLQGLTDTEPHEDSDTAFDRDIVDLIWFPTGGGKTEAYLALTAFEIFYRRMRYPNTCDGAAVIMRYTLRLLASQQFSRASALICACEWIRADCQSRNPRYPAYELGKVPITIGLWIGGAHTPNKNDEAKDFCEKLQNARNGTLEHRKDRYNRFQVLVCPWCGASLTPSDKARDHGKWGYAVDDKARFYLHCVRRGCPFEKRLPIQVVDDELYKEPPTLLFATVDKFAMMAWRSEVGNFFASRTKNRCPELIIQDELHLISGPLGSIVGLYEAAMDALCSAKGVRPKIVASTATIRRADDQCWGLYNRTVRQFPPPGLDAADSFFAKEADLKDRPGREYVGILPFGKTKAMLQTKVMSTLLQYTKMLPMSDAVKDQYWTLTSYFNSLRDLGKCSGLVDDDIKDSMKRLCRRLADDSIVRQIATAAELTSRVTTTELNKRLKRLETDRYSEENQKNGIYAINVLLATNMISVGVDVARLNLMTVVGQPKLTSEYIQATSRVGRSNPGLICVLYDATKSRDRSHYEQFRTYHGSFYRFVEPTSVTPFSAPARERALHAVLLSLIRHREGMDVPVAKDADAKNFVNEGAHLEAIKAYLVDRLESVAEHTQPGVRSDADVVAEEMDAFLEEWAERAARLSSADRLFYGQKYIVNNLLKPNERRLLKPFGVSAKDDARETLTSMRNVDQSIPSHMLIWED